MKSINHEALFAEPSLSQVLLSVCSVLLINKDAVLKLA